jgi:fatty-acyl-CoA synthase
MTAQEWSIPAVLDVVTGVAPEREMVVCGDIRRTFAEEQDRTRRLARHLIEAGLKVERERADLEAWECGQGRVALVMSNGPEYLEAMVGAYRARAVPYNVNHQYNAAEIAALVDSIGANAIVYHRRLGPVLAEISGLADMVLIEVDDGSGVEPIDGSVSFEDAIAGASDSIELPEPTPDDLYMVCTGGTTGVPKGVLWRQADIYVAAMTGSDATTAESIAAGAEGGSGVFLAAPPMMHGAAQWTAFSAVLNGGTVVLHDDSKRFDARTILSIAESERATVITIVGDAFARPIIEELQAGNYDLSSLGILGTGGAATNPEHKHALLELLPHILIMDGYGASETGAAGYAPSSKGNETREFSPAPGSEIVDADMTRFLESTETEIGWAVRTGRIPLGYLNDPEKTRKTFITVDGRRASLPGDRAHYNSEGRITMLGRDSMVINTGGEKVYVEEVEEALRQHPDVADALVVGREDERFGQIVVGLVEPQPGKDPAPAELRAFAAERVARYKAPRAVLICEQIGRHPTGKADYGWAKKAALDAVSATD